MGSLKSATGIYLMNNWMTSDPESFLSPSELKLFFDHFGPLSGRYHMSLPKQWIKHVQRLIEDWDDIAKKRASRVLQRAWEKGALYARPDAEWNDNESWLLNVERFDKKNPGLLKAVFTHHPKPNGLMLERVFSLDELELPPTEEESILAQPEEYRRVSNILLKTRPELLFIDPYLDPTNTFIYPVLKAMIGEIANGKCQSVKLWVRDSTLKKNGTSFQKIKTALEELKYESKANSTSFEYIVVDDNRRRDRMHARYLLSLQGGIRFDQGFQQLRKGVKVDVAPIGKAVLDDLTCKFIDGDNDLRVTHRIKL